MCTSSPAPLPPPPPPPAAPPPPPTPVDPAVIKTRQSGRRRRAALAQGRDDTIVTSPQGLTGDAGFKKTLLGL